MQADETIPAPTPENHLSNLEALLLAESIQKYFGPSVAMKLEALSIAIEGKGKASDLARRYHVSRQAAHAMVRKARKALRNAAS